MRRVLAAAALTIFALSACAVPAYTCTDPLGCLEIPSGSPVVIGLLYTSEGPNASFGLDALEQVEQAIEAKEFLLGHEIDLIREGTDCTAEGDREAATRLARTSNLLAVIGPTCLSESEITYSILRNAGLAMEPILWDATTLTPYRPNASAATDLLFTAIEQVAIRGRGGMLYIPRTALREALEKNGDIP